MKNILVVAESAIVAIIGGGITALADAYSSNPNAPFETAHIKRTFIIGAVVSIAALFRRRPGGQS